jgi:peptide/nickel transport system substrate-binding protein
VRKAANLCLNRAELKSYLGGYMTEATGVYEADSPWHGKPTFQIKYDPDTARKLMTEAGYSAANRCTSRWPPRPPAPGRCSRCR